MTSDKLSQEIRAHWFSTLEAERTFYIRHSAAGLGLLMTLQTFRLPNSLQEVTGPAWLWCLSLASFGVYLLVSAWSYWLDARLLFSLVEDVSASGETGDHPKLEKILSVSNAAIRGSFTAGVVTSDAYFIFQRILAG